MNYLVWAFLALAAYSLVPPLANLALVDIPSEIVVFLSNAVLIVGAGILVVVSDVRLAEWVGHSRAPYAYAAGVFLTVGIVAYYRALELGPISVVVPIFGMFIVTSSLLGVVFLDETMTLRKGLAIVFAAAAVYLTAVE